MSAGSISLKKLVGNDRLLQTLQEDVLGYKHYDENLYTTIENYIVDYLKVELS